MRSLNLFEDDRQSSREDPAAARQDHAAESIEELQPVAGEHAVAAPLGSSTLARPSVARVLALQRVAGNHAVAAALGGSRPTRPLLQRARQYSDAAIDAWVTANPPNPGEEQSDYLIRVVPLFEAAFPQRDRTDLSYARRRMQGHGAPPAAPPALAFAATFNAHLDGGHFGNAGAGYHIYNAAYTPPTVQQQNGQPHVVFGAAYDGGARQGTVHRNAGPTVASTFFPDGWTTATVRGEITQHWANLRQLHGLVHVITRGRNNFAICVNLAGGQVVSAFPAHRGPGGRWTD